MKPFRSLVPFMWLDGKEHRTWAELYAHGEVIQVAQVARAEAGGSLPAGYREYHPLTLFSTQPWRRC
jgi:hypothetical protein